MDVLWAKCRNSGKCNAAAIHTWVRYICIEEGDHIDWRQNLKRALETTLGGMEC